MGDLFSPDPSIDNSTAAPYTVHKPESRGVPLLETGDRRYKRRKSIKSQTFTFTRGYSPLPEWASAERALAAGLRGGRVFRARISMAGTAMLAQERYDYILEALQRKRTVQAAQLMRALDVSGETVRRDLEYLEKEGFLTRVRGGAALVKMDTTQGLFRSRMKVDTEEKWQIALKALEYVREGFSIGLDHSTTGVILARAIKEKFRRLTVVTNSNEVVSVFSDVRNYRIIHCGGTFNYDELACFGDLGMSHIKNLNLDVAFIGCGGISIREGLTENFLDGASMLRAFLEAAQQKIVIADHSKFDKVTFVKICDLSDVDVIITDDSLKQKTKEKYLAVGVDIG